MLKATHQQTKTYNNRLVLKTIYDAGQVSRAGVARLTHLTRVTVSEIVAELIADGLVTEVGTGPSTGGKAPIMLSVIDDARQMISLDLAADAFRGAVVNLRGQVRFAVSLPRQSQQGEQAAALLYELVDRLLQAVNQPLIGIGVGAPGIVDATNGVVLNAIHLGWKNLPLAKLLGGRYNLPVQIANDSQAAALAEYLFGGCHTQSNLVAIQVGRGIGCGVVLESQLYMGDSFSAGEIGHVRAVEGGALCRCGNYGCLETVASSTAILQAAQTACLDQPDLYRTSLFSREGISPQELTLEQLAQAFISADRLATQVLQVTAEHLGSAVAHLVSALNIHTVVITGEISAFGPNFLKAVQQETSNRILPAAAQHLSISSGCLKENVIILGACALLLTKELGLHPTRFPKTADGRQ